MHQNHYLVKVVHALAIYVILGEINYRFTLMPLSTKATEWCGHVTCIVGMHHNHYLVKVACALASSIILGKRNYRFTLTPLSTKAVEWCGHVTCSRVCIIITTFLRALRQYMLQLVLLCSEK